MALPNSQLPSSTVAEIVNIVNEAMAEGEIQSPVSGGGSTAITAVALMAARRAGTLVIGTTYQVESGHRYVADSVSHFIPVSGAPILSGPQTTILGDSFGANGLYLSRLSTMAIHGWTNTHIPVPLEFVANRSVAGKSYADILSVQVPPTLTDASETVWVTAGRNVWLPVATSSTQEQGIAQLRACLDALTPVKQLVIVDGSSSGVLASHDRATEVPGWNTRVAAECARYPNVVFNDIYAAMVDPASAVGDVLASAAYDAILHPNTKGAQRIGLLSAKNLAPKIRILPRWDAVALTGSPTWTGTAGTKTLGSGTITGNVPDNINVWCSAGSPAVTLAAKNTAGSGGTRLNVVVANAGIAGRVDVQLATTTLWNSQLTAGDWVRGWVGLRLKSVTAFSALYVTMVVTGGGGTTTFAFAPNAGEVAGAAIETPYVCRVPIPPVQLGLGFTAINISMALLVGATTGAADFDVWDYSLEKLVAA